VRIYFDHQIFSLQEFGGISKYFAELMEGMARSAGHHVVFPDIYTNNHYLHLLHPGLFRTFFHGTHFKGKTKLLWKINSFLNARHIRKSDFDIYHPTFINPFFLQQIGSKPFVMTIHDMTQELFADHFSKTDDVGKLKKILALKARKIIAISENTKQDILRLYDNEIDESVIHVVHHGIRFDVSDVCEPAMILPESYLLFVGGRGGYKNFDRLLETLARVRGVFPEIQLLCVGGGGFLKPELARISELDQQNHVKYVSVNESELNFLYRRALALVYPSLNEGFGLTILEAFANRCPVLLADASCFPEIAGAAALYFDPYDIDSITSTLMDFLQHRGEYTPGLVAKGTEQLNLFTPKRMVENTLSVYESAI
jgi:glycosyltransferase involved in cell wall biosynthesis